MSLPLKEVDHPVLVMNPDGREAAKKRISESEAAREVWEGIQREADSLLKKVIEYPDRGGQWWHWYSCKNCGSRLRTEGPTRHVCPDCGEVYSGWPYDDVVLDRIHQGLAKDSRTLGIAYQLSGDRRYADKAVEILKGYAERYLDYPLHNIHGKEAKGGGRVSPQTLDEAVWLIKIAQGFDCVWDAMTEEERIFIADKMLLPAAELIKDHQWGIHNICCWHAAAYGLVGLALGREHLTWAAIYGPKGFVKQVEEGVKDDGLWYEGSWGYHFYTMSALEPLAIAAYNVGIDLYTERYKGMYALPLLYMAPDGQLPAFNDSGRSQILTKGFAPRYEIAYARWRDPLFGRVVALGERRNESALLYGADEVEENAPALGSRIFHSAGTAILRSGDNYLALDFGEHGGGHGHPDKLNFVLWGRGKLLSEDPGCIAYGNPAHNGFYKQTVSHNTVVVDGKSQAAATGVLEHAALSDNAGAVVANAGKAYDGVTIRRAVALAGDLVLDIVHCSSEEPHQYDWFFHCRGDLDESQDLAPLDEPLEGQGYEWIEAWKRGPIDGSWQASWRTKEGLGLTLAQAGSGEKLHTGLSRGNPPTVRPPMVMARAEGNQALFITALGILGQGGEDVSVFQPQVKGNALGAKGSLGGKEALLLVSLDDGKVTCEDVTVKGKGIVLLLGDSKGWTDFVASEDVTVRIR